MLKVMLLDAALCVASLNMFLSYTEYKSQRKKQKRIVNMKQSTKGKDLTTPVSKKVEIWELPMHTDILFLNLLPFLLNFDITRKINQSIISFIIYKN